MRSRGKILGTGFAILCVVGIGAGLAATGVPTKIQQTGTQPQHAESSVRVLAPGPLQAPEDIQLVDYTYLGERPHWYGAVPPRKPVWVDIPILTSEVIIGNLLFVVSDSDWTFAICEDKSFGGCTFSALRGSSFCWSGDYGYSTEPITYVDRDGSNLIHVLVEGEDWFTFRALIHYTVN
jgi:hypothetical protein